MGHENRAKTPFSVETFRANSHFSTEELYWYPGLK